MPTGVHRPVPVVGAPRFSEADRGHFLEDVLRRMGYSATSVTLMVTVTSLVSSYPSSACTVSV